MILKEVYNQLRTVMSEQDARYVIQKRTGLSHSDMMADPEREIDEKIILEDFQYYQKGVPLSRIYKEREFWGMKFKLSDMTLDPRPDTETLIEADRGLLILMKSYQGLFRPLSFQDHPSLPKAALDCLRLLVAAWNRLRLKA